MNYYNEFDPHAASWLRNLIDVGHLPAGYVDTRSIVDVSPDDLAGFIQCHFFAGIGGWPLAARLAGWPDDRELWTGSPPCQPFSVAGQQRGQADERHLWPHYFRLIAAHRPAVLGFEQVSAAVGKGWLDGVFADLESIGYACGATVVPACAVNAPHRRDRIVGIAERGDVGDAFGQGLSERIGNAGVLPALVGEPKGQDAAHADRVDGTVAYTDSSGRGARNGNVSPAGHGYPTAAAGSDECVAHANGIPGRESNTHSRGCADGSGAREVSGLKCADDGASPAAPWAAADWITGHDGKARRIPVHESGIRLLAHGVSGRMAVVRSGFKGDPTDPQALHWYNRAGALKGFGNAIVPQLFAELLGAYLDCRTVGFNNY